MSLLAVCTGYLMVIVDVTAVNVALPSLGRSLHTGVSGLQWVVAGYTIVFAALLLSGGAFGDRQGAKRVFQLGLAVFGAASAGCALAPSVGELVVARLVQGLGAALVVPTSLALLQAAYADPAARARAYGVWGGVAGIGAAAGPIVGGGLVAAAGWRVVFVVNVPIAVAGLLLAARYLPDGGTAPRRLDLPAQAVGVVALAGLAGGLIEAGRRGWTAPVVVACLAVSVTAAAAFVGVERRTASPMLPLGLFTDRTFSAASAVGLLINLGFYGQLFVASLYFQQLRGYSALRAGLALLPELAMASIASTLSGRMMARVGYRIPMIVGLGLGAAGLAGWVVAGARTPYLLVVPSLVATGFGMAMTMPAATAAVMGAAPRDRGGVASGVLNTARQVGGTVGISLLGALVAQRSWFVPGMRLGAGLAAGAFLLGCGLAVGLVAEPPRP